MCQATRGGETCFTSVELLCRMTGMTKPTLIAAKARLEKLGVIVYLGTRVVRGAKGPLDEWAFNLAKIPRGPIAHGNRGRKPTGCG